MKELKEERRETRLPDTINHHIQRVYEHEGSFYMLDKTLDGAPPFYTFYGLHFDPRKDCGMPTRIEVEGKEYWGDGLTWKEAEAKIETIILSDGIVLA